MTKISKHLYLPEIFDVNRLLHNFSSYWL